MHTIKLWLTHWKHSSFSFGLTMPKHFSCWYLCNNNYYFFLSQYPGRGEVESATSSGLTETRQCCSGAGNTNVLGGVCNWWVCNTVSRHHKAFYIGVHEILGLNCVLEIAPQRGEGEKREGVQILELSTQNLWPEDFVHPCICVLILQWPDWHSLLRPRLLLCWFELHTRLWQTLGY